MNKNTSVFMTSVIAAVLALGVVAVAIPNQAFAAPPMDQKKDDPIKVAVGGNGGSGGAGGAGGEGGYGGTTNNNGDWDTTGGTLNNNPDQDANGGHADGGHGGNANGGNACVLKCNSGFK